MNKNPFWLRKELADFEAMKKASKYYQPPIMSLEKLMRKSLRRMISLWLGLNLMDLITTLTALEMGYTEGNLIMVRLSSPELVVYKVGFALLTLALLAWIKKPYLLKYLCLGMGIVVVWNLIWVIIG
ncbi:hypothetical protein ES703_69341 [subsurface metagenome]